ncbi:MAG: ABC transporter permease [Patescibacteria group bacterium]
MFISKNRWAKIKSIVLISFSLAKANFTLRTEGSYLGNLWYLLNPLVSFFLILFIRKAAFIDTGIENYPAYLFMGIAGLNFFRQATVNSIRAITGNVDYIKSMNSIAPEVLVISAVFQAALSHISEFILIIGFIVYWQIPLVGLLFYPIIFAIFFFLVIGISLIFATIGVYVNDLDNVWTIFTQLLFLVTPIFYAVTAGSRVYMANLANPLFYFLEISRSVVIYSTCPPPWMIAAMLVFSIGLFTAGCLIFNRYKKKFAELV